MSTQLFGRFRDAILKGEFETGDEQIVLERRGRLTVCYAPFDYTNENARVVLVGITPGRSQMLAALREARRQLASGADDASALRAAKLTAAFGGPMRANLIALLDRIGINRWLQLESCVELFSESRGLVHTTSALRYPVFVNDANYGGTPSMVREPFLRRYLLEHFGEEARRLTRAVFVPLGDRVLEALKALGAAGLIAPERILEGLPHPSGANAERIAYFLGRKAAADLSTKTDARKLDAAREALCAMVGRLGSLP